LQVENDPPVFSVETQSIAPIARRTPAAAEPQRLKTLANLQRAIVYTVKPRLLQYRAVHHDSERAAETQSACRSLRPFINFSGKRHNQSAIASHMRL
jgi:hypothetical protein